MHLQLPLVVSTLQLPFFSFLLLLSIIEEVALPVSFVPLLPSIV